jgi:hypothetical protein
MGGCTAAGSSLASASPSLDPHMRWPGHFPFALWKSRALYPRAQEDLRSRHYFPLDILIGEPIADLELHRHDRYYRSVRALRHQVLRQADRSLVLSEGEAYI